MAREHSASKARKAARRSNRKLKQKTKRSSRSRSANKQHLIKELRWLLPNNKIFADVKTHGNASWTARVLASIGLLWAFSANKNVTDAYDEAVDAAESLPLKNVPACYTGFMNVMVNHSAALTSVLCTILQERMQAIGGKHWRVGRWAPIAVDGSRSTAPRSRQNEKAFCAADYGTGKTAKYRKKKSKGMRRKKNEKAPAQPPAPQVWITLLWHMGLRLPWSWQLGPSDSSERDHARELIEAGGFPENTLFVGDAGFVGYDFWKHILDQQGNFLVRVGGNVHLLSEAADYERGADNEVLCWPQAAQRARQAPLRLRLVKIKIGRTTMHMLTSVLKPDQLTSKQIIKLYKMRWGIEVEFRGLKQTLEKAKLQCRNSERLLVELNWSLLAMAVAELLALKYQLSPAGKELNSDSAAKPSQRSLAKTMRALRRCLKHLTKIAKPGKELAAQLAAAVTDVYKRTSSQQARYRPPNPDKKPLGAPKVRKINKEEQRKYEKLEATTAA
jgi:hypothetical protein